jgi:hypothetical protein
MAEGPWSKYAALADDPAPAPAAPAGPWAKYAAAPPAPASAPEKSGEQILAEMKERDAKGRAGALRALGQGVTFGFGDEIEGALGAVAGLPLRLIPDALAKHLSPEDQAARQRSPAENYVAARDQARASLREYEGQHPVLNMTAQAAGGFAVPVPGSSLAGKVLPSVHNPLARAGINAAVAGAVTGGIGGAGGAATVAEALPAAARGAVIGGVAGPVVAAGAGGIGAGLNNVRTRFSDNAAEELARRRVAEALARDDRTTQQVAARLPKLGDRAVIADAAGENTRQLLDTVATQPGRTGNRVEQLIHDRQAGRAGTLIKSAEQGLGADGKRLASSLDEWMAQRAADAKPLYDQVRAIPITPDAELTQIVQAADQLGASGMARKIATAERAPFTLSAKSSAWSMADLDRLKQGLDAQISKSLSPTGQSTPMTRALTDLKTALTAKLDDMTGGAYAQARAAYAGPSALMDAAKTGRGVLTLDPAEIQRATAGMGSSEVEAFRLGAFEALRSKLGTESGQTQLLKMWKEPATRERLQTLFGDERSFREFASAAAAEARLKGLERTGRGSQTARREAAADDLNAATARDTAGALADAKTGNVLGLLDRVRTIYGRVATPEPVRDRIGQILMTPSAQAAPELMSLRDIVAQVNAQRAQQAIAAGKGGGIALSSLLNP